MFVPHRRHTSPLSVTGISLLFSMKMMFVPHRRHTSPLFVTGDIFTVLYLDDVRTSQETHVSTVCYGDSFTFYFSFFYDIRNFAQLRDEI
jgi:hypothetical protein